MKKILCITALAFAFVGCEKTTVTPAATDGDKDTTVVVPGGESKTENNTTIVKPAESSTTETKTETKVNP